MIVSRIQGGIGNQLFQYAYGRHLSLKYKTNFYLDKSFYNYQGLPIRVFSLDKFNKTHINFTIEPTRNLPVYKINDTYVYNEAKILNNAHYYLDGYWQSEKYFIESEDVIRDEFTPSDVMMNKLKKTPLIYTNTVSMHIRRTDYLTSNGYHPVQPIKYYEDAIDIVGEYDHIFVFSDDIQWCKDNLKFNNMIFMEGFDDIEDLFIMSMCKNNIITNSSFSWWSAWLNNNPDKKVIAPNNWFGKDANINTSDLLSEKYIKI